MRSCDNDLINLFIDVLLSSIGGDNVCLACAQPNTQPMARTDDLERSPDLRCEGREPMFIKPISLTGVAS